MNAALLVQHLLEPHQVVDENPVGGIQGDAVGQVLRLAHHLLAQGAAVSLGDDAGDGQPGQDDDD